MAFVATDPSARMITRRGFFKLAGGLLASGAAVTLYGALIEPMFRLRVTRYALTPPGWPADLRLRLALVADVHACRPWMSAERIVRIVDLVNGLGADGILLLGDYVASHRFQSPEEPRLWAQALRRLQAPLGVHAILGNHDWWSDPDAMRRGVTDRSVLPYAAKALQDAGLTLYRNEAVRLVKEGKPFWLAGLADQLSFAPILWQTPDKDGDDDLPGLLASINDEAPIVLMAHEPDIFPNVPARVSLTLSGHTHGGQIDLFGWTPIVPSRYGSRYVYGHIVESARHLIVSGGLGMSGLPVRIGSPPEIVVVDLGGA